MAVTEQTSTAPARPRPQILSRAGKAGKQRPALLSCKCGCTAGAPQWSAKARGWLVQCSGAQCPAVAQAKTESGAGDLWNQVASKVGGRHAQGGAGQGVQG